MRTVLIADQQPLTVAGLTNFLQDNTDFTIAGYVAERSDLEMQIRKLAPDIIILDYNLPAYITMDDLRSIKEWSPQTKTLVISSDDEKASILQVLQFGVIGYLTKTCSRDEILMALHAIARGEKFFCHKILNIIMEKHFSPEPIQVLPGILTVRETEILKLLASGYSTQKVADELYLSPHTVHTHRKSIIKKLNIKSPTEFVIYAMDFGLIKAKQ